MAGCARPECDSPAVKRGSLQNGSPVVSSCSAAEAPSCPPVIYRKAGHLIFYHFFVSPLCPDPQRRSQGVSAITGYSPPLCFAQPVLLSTAQLTGPRQCLSPCPVPLLAKATAVLLWVALPPAPHLPHWLSWLSFFPLFTLSSASCLYSRISVPG